MLLAVLKGVMLAGPAVALTGLEPPAASTQRTIVGLHVPWAAGGLRIERDGSVRQHPGEWPTIPVRSLRLWDTRTAWLNLEPAPDQWAFEHLDAQVAIARRHSVDDITLVLWGTPKWAARSLDADDASWLGPGAASPPRSMEDWHDFVAQVATRYRGVITAYEIGNEPEDAKFWRGSATQFANMVATAARTIDAIDPAATIVAPAELIAMERKARQPNESSASTDRQDFLGEARRRPSWAANVDALAFHWYPRTSAPPSRLRTVVARLRAEEQAAGLQGVPLWLTEVNYRGVPVSPERERTLVKQTNELARILNLPRVYWYAWTDLGPANLLQFQPGSPAAEALRAHWGHARPWSEQNVYLCPDV
jgi:hypothetical protein